MVILTSFCQSDEGETKSQLGGNDRKTRLDWPPDGGRINAWDR